MPQKCGIFNRLIGEEDYVPNIEIRGFTSKDTERLKVRIDRLMQEIGLAGDTITSVIDMRAESCSRTRLSTPYIRICATKQDEIDQILEAFCNARIRVDIEWLVLGGFISAKGSW